MTQADLQKDKPTYVALEICFVHGHVVLFFLYLGRIYKSIPHEGDDLEHEEEISFDAGSLVPEAKV